MRNPNGKGVPGADTGEGPATPLDLPAAARAITRGFIRDFEAARDEYQDFVDRYGDDGPPGKGWNSILLGKMDEAQRQLTGAILAWYPGYDPDVERCTEWVYEPLRGISCGGRLYLAVTNTTGDGEDLKVADLSEIVDIDEPRVHEAALPAPDRRPGRKGRPAGDGRLSP